jgi:Flp pilus assembly protein TadG
MLIAKFRLAPIALRQRFLRIARANEGVAAVEFALILPIMLFMFIGVLEISHAVTVDRRVSQVTSSTGDLVARAEIIIPATVAIDAAGVGSVEDIMKVGGYLMAPYPSMKLKMTIRSVATGATADPANRKEKWRCTSNDISTNAFACECVNPSGGGTALVVPDGLLGPNDGVVVAEVEYGYKPVLFDKFFKSAWGESPTGFYTFKDKIYQKPRGVVAKLKTAAYPSGCG